MENNINLTDMTAPDAELQYIRKIIADSRRAYAEDGKPYILWGVLVAIGMTVTYFSALMQKDFYTGYIWIGLVVLGYAYIIYYVRKKKKEEPRVKSMLDRIQGAIWGAVGGTLGLVISLITIQEWLGKGEAYINPFYICFLASAILGIGYFLSGIVHDLKWLKNIGYVWWAGAIIMFFWQSIHVLGLYALMIVLFQVVPGIILNRKYRSEQPDTASEA